jgi:Protein of unknown function (DUF3800)
MPGWIAYLDDAGDVQTVTAANAAVPPVLVFGAVALPAESLAELTRTFLDLKRRFFGGRMTSRHLLDHVLVEVKGAELRTLARGSHRQRRRAILFLNELLALLEAVPAQIFGRVWIKELDVPLDGRALNTFSVQAMCGTFQHLLEEADDQGLMIVDSSTPGLNSMVSHSIFTQRFRAAGDEYSRLVEMPVFGHSKNHVGLQIADIVSSGLISPLASRAYCTTSIHGVHVHPRYEELMTRFARRLRSIQHRYQDQNGAWRGGFTVSDPAGGRHGGHLFHTRCGRVCTP